MAPPITPNARDSLVIQGGLWRYRKLWTGYEQVTVAAALRAENTKRITWGGP